MLRLICCIGSAILSTYHKMLIVIFTGSFLRVFIGHKSVILDTKQRTWKPTVSNTFFMKNKSAKPIASTGIVRAYGMIRIRIYDPWSLGPCMIHQRNWWIHSKAESTLRGWNLKTQLFISTVRGPPVRPTIQINRHENGAFRHSSNWKNLKTCRWKIFWKMELIDNAVVTLTMWFPCPSFPPN